MTSIFLRILILYNLLITLLLRFLPKKLRNFLPPKQSPSPFTNSDNTPAEEPELVATNADELRRVFEMFDQNGDGRISKDELNHSLESMGIIIPDPELTQMMMKIDVNEDGCVDMDEFGELYRNIIGGKGEEEEEEEEIKEAFKVFDKNGDGFISVEELKVVMASLGLKEGLCLDDCRSMIVKVDGNGDGMVDLCEFKRMMSGSGVAALAG